MRPAKTQPPLRRVLPHGFASRQPPCRCPAASRRPNIAHTASLPSCRLGVRHPRPRWRCHAVVSLPVASPGFHVSTHCVRHTRSAFLPALPPPSAMARMGGSSRSASSLLAFMLAPNRGVCRSEVAAHVQKGKLNFAPGGRFARLVADMPHHGASHVERL